ncbi:hypothetical protein PM082_003748 [Marasmius tenuissimus]|nr:hypothetical protein PM082_003748 [Marasmius tenuissimus]
MVPPATIHDHQRLKLLMWEYNPEAQRRNRELGGVAPGGGSCTRSFQANNLTKLFNVPDGVIIAACLGEWFMAEVSYANGKGTLRPHPTQLSHFYFFLSSARPSGVRLESLAKYIKSQKCKKIVLMLGAGVSTSAGIPDFRSPETVAHRNSNRDHSPRTSDKYPLVGNARIWVEIKRIDATLRFLVNSAPLVTYITGSLELWPRVAEVSAIRIPGYWLHKKGSTIEADVTAGIARGLLEHCDNVQRVFSPEYRLSSTKPWDVANPFPAALLDALAAYQYLVEEVGFAPSDIIVEGDSAGGNLAQALTRYLVEHRDSIQPLAPPSAIVLLSPWADITHTHCGPASTLAKHRDSDYLDISADPAHSSSYASHALTGPHGRSLVDGLKELKELGVRKLIVDVTNNGGGYICIAHWLHRIIVGPKSTSEPQAGLDSAARAGPLAQLIVKRIAEGGDPQEYLEYNPVQWRNTSHEANRTYPNSIAALSGVRSPSPPWKAFCWISSGNRQSVHLKNHTLAPPDLLANVVQGITWRLGFGLGEHSEEIEEWIDHPADVNFPLTAET